GDDLLEQLESLAAQVRRDNAEPGGIPARSRKAVHQTRSDRIADDRHDDRYRSGCALESLGGRRAARDQDVDIAPREVGGELRKPLYSVLAPSPFDRDRLPLDIAELPQPIEERLGAKRE